LFKAVFSDADVLQLINFSGEFAVREIQQHVSGTWMRMVQEAPVSWSCDTAYRKAAPRCPATKMSRHSTGTWVVTGVLDRLLLQALICIFVGTLATNGCL